MPTPDALVSPPDSAPPAPLVGGAPSGRPSGAPPLAAANATAASAVAAATGAPPSAETVVRPEPGLGRGIWEAPAWLFYALALAALLGSIVWLGALYRGRKVSK